MLSLLAAIIWSVILFHNGMEIAHFIGDSPNFFFIAGAAVLVFVGKSFLYLEVNIIWIIWKCFISHSCLMIKS